MRKERGLFELSAELDAVAALSDSLACHLDNKGEALTERHIKIAMFGISHYLGRISEELLAVEVES